MIHSRLSPLRAAALAVLLALTACGRAESADGPALGEVGLLPSPAAPGSAEPNLALAPDGGVYLTWQEPAADSATALRFAVLEGDGWSEPRTIALGRDWFVNWADFPGLAVLPGGRLATYYLQRSGGEKSYHYDIRMVQSVDGGETWSEPFTLHRDSVPAEHGFVSLYAAGDSLGAVWLDGRKSDPKYGGVQEMTLRHTTVAADGSLGAETMVDDRICDCCQTAVAQTSRGPVVVYRDRTQDEIRDIYVTRLVDGAWTEGRAVHDDRWNIAACPVNGPAIAAEGERVAVAWFTGARDTAKVMVAFSDDAGATFGAPVRVDAGDPAGRVDVELAGGGGALVSWIERTGADAAEVRVRHVATDGEAAAPIVVATSSGARASGFPRMTRAGDSIVFAWTEPGTPSQVRVARAAVGGAR